MLLTRAALGNAINAATGCKDEIADPRLGGKLAQPDGGIQIDSFGHFFETIAHRVVGNGRQVDHRVSVSQQAWIDRSNIAEMLKIGRATSELQSLMRISYAVFCLKKKKDIIENATESTLHNQDSHEIYMHNNK